MNKWQHQKYRNASKSCDHQPMCDSLCVDLIGPYTRKGKDEKQIVFMCVTMIDPETDWFKVMEWLVSQLVECDKLWAQRGKRTWTNINNNKKNPILINHQQH